MKLEIQSCVDELSGPSNYHQASTFWPVPVCEFSQLTDNPKKKLSIRTGLSIPPNHINVAHRTLHITQPTTRYLRSLNEIKWHPKMPASLVIKIRAPSWQKRYVKSDRRQCWLFDDSVDATFAKYPTLYMQHETSLPRSISFYTEWYMVPLGVA